MTAPLAPVLFGKLPAHGDFIVRGLSAAQREAWDAWLSEQITSAQQKEAEGDFARRHAQAPRWRFFTSPGEFARGWMSGILAPSFDSVGRAFFVLAAVDAPEGRWSNSRARDCALAIDEILSDALRDVWPADQIEEAIRQWTIESDFLEDVTITPLTPSWSRRNLPGEGPEILFSRRPEDLFETSADRPAEVSSPTVIDHATVTDVGKVRAHNEDAFLAVPERRLWAVADGMGGLERGEWASATVVEALRDARLEGEALKADILAISAAIQAANATVHAGAISGGGGGQSGSTVAALLLADDMFGALWAGDSRVAVLRDSTLYPISHDHSEVQAMIDSGELTAAEAWRHPMGNLITRAVGIEPMLDVDVVMDWFEPADVFLLSTDGLHDIVPAPEIEAVLMEVAAGSSATEACRRLVQRACDLGAPDNVTVIVVAVRSSDVGGVDG